MKTTGNRNVLTLIVAVSGILAIPTSAQAEYVDGMNFYEYVGSAPVVNVDPMGLERYHKMINVRDTRGPKSRWQPAGGGIRVFLDFTDCSQSDKDLIYKRMSKATGLIYYAMKDIRYQTRPGSSGLSQSNRTAMQKWNMLDQYPNYKIGEDPYWEQVKALSARLQDWVSDINYSTVSIRCDKQNKTKSCKSNNVTAYHTKYIGPDITLCCPWFKMINNQKQVDKEGQIRILVHELSHASLGTTDRAKHGWKWYAVEEYDSISRKDYVRYYSNRPSGTVQQIKDIVPSSSWGNQFIRNIDLFEKNSYRTYQRHADSLTGFVMEWH